VDVPGLIVRYAMYALMGAIVVAAVLRLLERDGRAGGRSEARPLALDEEHELEPAAHGQHGVRCRIRTSRRS